MRLSARGDYAVRAAVELAAAGGPVKVADLAERQDIPPRYLQNILLTLARAEIVHGRRGAEGGYELARPARQVTIADIIRAVEGPLMGVRGERPDAVRYQGSAAPLKELWIALRANVRAVLERVTLADLVEGTLPADVAALARQPGAWDAH